MELTTLIIGCLTLAVTLALGLLNYNVNKQTKKLKQYKKSYHKSLENLRGFIELEEKYSEELAKLSNTSPNIIKLQFRKKLQHEIVKEFSGEKTIDDKIKDIEKD